MEEKDSVKAIGKQVAISRINPDNIRSVFANDLLVTHSDNEFFLTFSEIEIPPILEEKDLQNLTTIEAITRIKLIITPRFAEAILKTLSSNLDNYKSNRFKENVPDK